MEKFTMNEENPHTVRVYKMGGNTNTWVVECKTCSFKELSGSREQAFKDMGYHFGRLSTKTWPYGRFLGEE